MLERGRARVQPQRRDRDRDGPAQRSGPRDGQLAAGQRQRTRGGASRGALENRAVSFDYEPGSTFKAVTVSGALQSGADHAETAFNIPDQIQVADRTIHDDTEHAEETLTTSQILAQSSNVGAIKIGMLEGAARFNEWVHRFGFGAPTGVGLPGEEIGKVLPLSQYSGSSMGNLPIGQGELVTPLQMATRLLGDRQRRYAAPAAHRAVGRRPPAARAGRAPRDLERTTAAELRQMLRGRARAGRHGQRGIDSRLSARGQDGHGEQDRPGDRRILTHRLHRVVHRLRAGVRPASSCARSSSTNRRRARSTAGRSPRPRSGRS